MKEPRFDIKNRIYIKPGIQPLLKDVDSLVFDVDGVLLDVHRSFWEVILLTTKRYLVLNSLSSPFLPRKQHIRFLKMAGGFNNDWDVTSALILISLSYSFGHSLDMKELAEEIYRRGGGLEQLEKILEERIPQDFPRIRSLLERSMVEHLFKEIYAGKETFLVYGFQPQFISPDREGLYKKEVVLLTPKDVPPFIEKVGLFTGRTAGETSLALQMTGFSSLIPKEFVITADDGLNKPDAGKLKDLARKMGVKRAIYVGDALDDLRSVPPADPLLLSCIVNKKHRRFFKKEGADIIVPTTKTLMNLLKEERL